MSKHSDYEERYTDKEIKQIAAMGKRINDELNILDLIEMQKEHPNRMTPNKMRRRYLTNEKIAEEFHISRHSVDSYIKGERPLTVINLLKFCKLLNCEAGYILGEFNEKHKSVASVVEQTGLSKEAFESYKKNMNSVIYKKTITKTDPNEFYITSIEDDDTLLEHSKYSEVLNTILLQYPQLITMLGQILFCKELKLEHLCTDTYLSAYQKNAIPGSLQTSTLEMCISFALYLYRLCDDVKNVNPGLDLDENFEFAQYYISERVKTLKEENVHYKNEIYNMEQSSIYGFGVPQEKWCSNCIDYSTPEESKQAVALFSEEESSNSLEDPNN